MTLHRDPSSRAGPDPALAVNPLTYAGQVARLVQLTSLRQVEGAFGLRPIDSATSPDYGAPLIRHKHRCEGSKLAVDIEFTFQNLAPTFPKANCLFHASASFHL